MSNMIELKENFAVEMGDADKILKILKKLKNYVEIISTSYTISTSGIGTNVMLNVKVKMKNDDYSEKTVTLHFDVTDYASW